MEDDAKNSRLDGNSIRILLTLLRKGTTNLSGLEEAVSNLANRKKKIEELECLGLVTSEISKDPRLSYRISLTERGKKFAAIHEVAEECLAGEFDIESESVDERIRELMAGEKGDARRLQMAVLRGGSGRHHAPRPRHEGNTLQRSRESQQQLRKGQEGRAEARGQRPAEDVRHGRPPSRHDVYAD